MGGLGGINDWVFHGGFFMEIGVDALIGMNTEGFGGGWLGSKISAGQSGGVFLLGMGVKAYCKDDRIGVVRVTGFFMGLSIYLFTEFLFLNFWYYLIYKFNWFSHSKMLCF